MRIVIDISKDRYDEIMSMDWKNCRRIYDEEIRAIHDGIALVQEPKKGHWRHYEGMLICSECGTEFYDDIMEYCGDDVPKWCPDCGAKMSEVEE